ncbi:hypothetical protein N7474_010675 [Penicillium riverlandense]|uniref:uncharacterized protein n=1 Tax=Penicillium riverlandense TaxID=1903569 RepID=UPI00254685E2|nr:uncharacterized protein N7474_010675 [Penicillium riverlandense]KAJ5807083.1 hypothetical protein N7474_010675 [Penicillium riverlandense]
MLRDLQRGVNGPLNPRSYCCVDQDDLKNVFYLWEECPDNIFRAIKATCTSEASELGRRLSPLLERPLSEYPIWRLEEQLRMMHRLDFPYSCLELLFVHNGKRPLWLPTFLDAYAPGGSNSGLYYVPVNRQGHNFLERSNGYTSFYCIEWNTFERREEVFTEPALRQGMKQMYKEERQPILQALGKTEEELTWEEDLQIFIESTGPEKVQRHFVHATLVDDQYLGLDNRKKLPCVIL